MPAAESPDRAVAAPRVSVITPFLNAGSFLAEAIESVRAQTLREWELLLVDDGSTDVSTAVARVYAERFPERIRYFEHPGHANRGKSVSRNLGIARARGEFVVFLDADDVLLPGKLERQVRLMALHPRVTMVYGNTEWWRSWDGSSRRRDRPQKLGVALDRTYSPPALLTTWLRKPGMVPSLCAVLARTEVVRRIGTFDEKIQDLYEDQIFLVKMVMSAEVFVESGCGERYRQHPDSTSARAIVTGEYHPVRPNRARQVFLQWLQDYLGSLGVPDAPLARALHAATFPYRCPRLHAMLYPFLSIAARFRW
jgi:glycosyltransferase involved in cell wall biosynthesis